MVTLRTLFILLLLVVIFITGFVTGVYTLPIMTQPPAASHTEILVISKAATYKGRFVKELKDSDALHYATGEIYFSDKHIAFVGEIAPGPDYRLYLAKNFIETEADFNAQKHTMVEIANINQFSQFVQRKYRQVDLSQFQSAIIWCEHFEQFISAAPLQRVGSE
ncbi:DM13 domain-containing protein [Pseudoalteromonas piscicida]|uniref:DM13 domain-containing protein n=1 Tax=Pseudoalteromonas piscicida TaxID=43662 RepID=UPI001CB716CD|nr:DM13 domain-containing protein [Pseudoalteromonas piscicida]